MFVAIAFVLQAFLAFNVLHPAFSLPHAYASGGSGTNVPVAIAQKLQGSSSADAENKVAEHAQEKNPLTQAKDFVVSLAGSPYVQALVGSAGLLYTVNVGGNWWARFRQRVAVAKHSEHLFGRRTLSAAQLSLEPRSGKPLADNEREAFERARERLTEVEGSVEGYMPCVTTSLVKRGGQGLVFDVRQ
jgi:hypothetical protein